MAETLSVTGTTRQEQYESLLPQIRALIDGESDTIANLSNIAAALHHGLGFFWTGFYFVRGNELVLGPFQGPVACTRIQNGKGVCGTAWKNKSTIVVPDVEKFPGHIACSALSRSEIVVPGFNSAGDVILVLDADSDELNFFSETDQRYLEDLMQTINRFDFSFLA